LVAEVKPKVNECVEDSNGNHVIQKIVESVNSDKVQFIIDSFKDRVYEMSVHQYGCRIIQRMLEHCEEPQIRPILNEVFQRVLDLTKDQYGNYVISHVLEHGNDSDKEFVISKMRKKVLMLSLHKFGSNVIEKCLVFGDPKQKEDIINEVVYARINNEEGQSHATSYQNNTLNDLIKDKYGNYVIQRVLDMSNEQGRKILIEKITKIGSFIKKQNKTHARHVFTFLEKKYNIVIPYVGGDSYEEEKKEPKKGSRRSTGKDLQRGNSDLSANMEIGSQMEGKQGSTHKRGSRGGKRKSQLGKQQMVDNLNDNIFEKAKE